MNITFVIPGIGISGGIRVVYEYANNLTARGHNVSVIYPFIYTDPMAKYNLRKLVGSILCTAGNIKQGAKVDWFDLKANLIGVPILSERFIPDGDVVIATRWDTAYFVNRLKRRKGEKYYLIQHYETWAGPEEKVNNSYKLGLHNIVISTWIKDILHNKLNVDVEAIILDAVDPGQFYPEASQRNGDKIRILLPYRFEKWKGSDDGIDAFETVRKKHSNIQLVMFGPNPRRVFPRYVEYHKLPYGDKLRAIYNSCDIFLYPSHCEGFGLPPMEAMACKCAVVSTRVGGIPDYTISGVTALLSPPKSPELLAENLNKMIEDRELRIKIAQTGYDYIKSFTWDKSANELEKVFVKYFDRK